MKSKQGKAIKKGKKLSAKSLGSTKTLRADRLGRAGLTRAEGIELGRSVQ